MWAGGGSQRGEHTSACSVPLRAAFAGSASTEDNGPRAEMTGDPGQSTSVKILGDPCPRLVVISAKLKRPGVNASPTQGTKETSGSKKLLGFLSCRKSNCFPLTSPSAFVPLRSLLHPPHPPPGDDAPPPQRCTAQQHLGFIPSTQANSEDPNTTLAFRVPAPSAGSEAARGPAEPCGNRRAGGDSGV